MSDFFQSGSEPIKVEGEAVCAVGVQSLTADREQGAGVNTKRTFVHLEDNSILDLDKGELSDEQDLVIASAQSSFAKTPSEFFFNTFIF